MKKTTPSKKNIVLLLKRNILGLVLGVAIGLVVSQPLEWINFYLNDFHLMNVVKMETNAIRSKLFDKTDTSGVEYFTINANISGKEVRLSIARVDSTKAHVRIASPASLGQRIDGGVGEYSGLTIKEFAVLGKYKVVHSAGFLDSWTPPYPLGYVKINSKEYNRVHRSWLTTGVFCTNGPEYSITRFKNDHQFAAWRDCIQAGPLIIEHRKSVLDISKNTWPHSSEAKEQSFLCIDSDKKLVMGITDSVPLKDILSLLSRVKEENGLGCVDAVAMSAKYTAGMIIKEQNGPNFEEIGATAVPLPNAIVVE